MQEFQVLKCVECGSIQVDIVKKVMKWTCKICNQKQSHMRIYYRSFCAKECRSKVEDLRAKTEQKRQLDPKEDQLKYEVPENLDSDRLSNKSNHFDEAVANEPNIQRKKELKISKSSESAVDNERNTVNNFSPTTSLSNRKMPNSAPASNIQSTSTKTPSRLEKIADTLVSGGNQPPTKKLKLLQKPQSKCDDPEDEWSIFY